MVSSDRHARAKNTSVTHRVDPQLTPNQFFWGVDIGGGTAETEIQARGLTSGVLTTSASSSSEFLTEEIVTVAK